MPSLNITSFTGENKNTLRLCPGPFCLLHPTVVSGFLHKMQTRENNNLSQVDIYCFFFVYFLYSNNCLETVLYVLLHLKATVGPPENHFSHGCQTYTNKVRITKNVKFWRMSIIDHLNSQRNRQQFRNSVQTGIRSFEISSSGIQCCSLLAIQYTG